MEHRRHDDPVLITVPDRDSPEQRVRTAVGLFDLRNALVCEARDTWLGLCGTRLMPSRAQMTPRVMRSFLKHTALLQVVEGGFRYRVVGDAVNLQQGIMLQGMTTADLDARLPGYGAQLARLYARACRRREILAYRGLYFRSADQHSFAHESIMAPLGDDGETPDHLIVVAA